MNEPREPVQDTRREWFLRGVVGWTIILFALAFVVALIPRNHDSTELVVTRDFILVAPKHAGATATWKGGSGQLPLAFRWQPRTGSWEWKIEEAVKVTDSSGNLLKGSILSPLDDMRVIPQPPTRWYEVSKRREQARRVYAESNWFIYYGMPDGQFTIDPKWADVAKTGQVLEMPESFVAPAGDDAVLERLTEDAIEKNRPQR